MLTSLRELLADLRVLKNDISKEAGPQISKVALREHAEAIATAWFSTVAPSVAQHHTIDAETVQRYSGLFGTLLKLSRPNNLKRRYLEVIGAILKRYHDDLILPIQTEPKLAKEVSLLGKMLAGLPSAEEDAYLREAVACASQGHLRAAAVLGWCAAIDRIHRCIEKAGLDKLNTASRRMAAATSGRFKRFNSPTSVNSLSELREVVDSNVLWILEGMQLIDCNQHTRLRSCFDLRCQSAHPGNAPVTEYNLLSFFSDINEIVLRNPNFSI
jgi:hypothetical protein